jgi:hypothetical protein
MFECHTLMCLKSHTMTNPNWAPMRPGGTGVGELWLGAGQQSICRSGNVEGRFTYFGQGAGERLPLIITPAGRAQIKIIADYVEGGSSGLGIVYIDATPNQAGRSFLRAEPSAR